jgi:hypothetical protein
MNDEHYNCPSCAEKINQDAISCRFCGTGLSQDYFRACTFCGEMIRKEATLCRYCKEKVAASQGDVVAGAYRRTVKREGSTLTNHILHTSTPVLTEKGRKVKDKGTLPAHQNRVIQLMDDYLTVETIIGTVEGRHRSSAADTMRIIQEFECEGIIYPIFPRIHFLANCYHDRKRFKLGRYMVEAGILNNAQLQELLEQQQAEGWGKSQRTFLGLLAVRAGYINTRELEVLLDEQYLYGRHYKASEVEEKSPVPDAVVESTERSMIGSLGAIDAVDLLQSLSTASKTGLLTVENRDNAFQVALLCGKPTHAKLNRLKGYHALSEFLTSWNEGVFVVRDKATSKDLDDSCSLSQPLDRILIDAALYQNQIAKILSALPNGRNTILEMAPTFLIRWTELAKGPLKYVDDSAVTEQDRELIVCLASAIDGLSTLEEVFSKFDTWPSHLLMKAVYLLIEYKLATVQHNGLFQPLSNFQRIATELQRSLGKEESKELLMESLHQLQKKSQTTCRFKIDDQGRVTINLAEVKRSGTPVAVLNLELRRWMEIYLFRCRAKMDPQMVDSVVAKIVSN